MRETLLRDVQPAYDEVKSKRSLIDWSDLAVLAINAHPDMSYDLVIVDETQDFSANQVRAVIRHRQDSHPGPDNQQPQKRRGTSRNEFAQADAPLAEFSAIAAGSAHTCEIKSDKTAVCWGNNENDQTDTPPGEFTAIAAGSEHTWAIKADRTIACWGSEPPTGVEFVS